jgi:hypothetical protein
MQPLGHHFQGIALCQSVVTNKPPGKENLGQIAYMNLAVLPAPPELAVTKKAGRAGNTARLIPPVSPVSWNAFSSLSANSPLGEDREAERRVWMKIGRYPRVWLKMLSVSGPLRR